MLTTGSPLRDAATAPVTAGRAPFEATGAERRSRASACESVEPGRASAGLTTCGDGWAAAATAIPSEKPGFALAVGRAEDDPVARARRRVRERDRRRPRGDGLAEALTTQSFVEPVATATVPDVGAMKVKTWKSEAA